MSPEHGSTLKPGMPEEEASGWLRRAWQLAWFTVGYNLLEGAVSIGFGVSDDSVALWGFGFDSLIEVGSAVLVMVRLRHGFGAKATLAERRATGGIGWLFLLLAGVVAIGALFQLSAQRHPPTTLPGLVISALSLSFMAGLWRAKLKVAKALDSAALRSDAACSRACIHLSLVLFAGSVGFLLVPALWWVDAVAALALALLIAREGWEMRAAARQPDFDGGCGCH